MAQISNPFRTTLNKSVLVDLTSCTAGQFIQIGELKIEAGSAYSVGFGAMEGQDSASGRIYADFRTNSASPGALLDGVFRIDIHNPQDRVVETIFECRTEDLRTSAGDRRQQLPFPFINAIVTEDWKIVFKIKADTTQTLGKANTAFVVNATSFEAR